MNRWNELRQQATDEQVMLAMHNATITLKSETATIEWVNLAAITLAMLLDS
jgi:hypothetical protein